jgi:hypothetical protein
VYKPRDLTDAEGVRPFTGTNRHEMNHAQEQILPYSLSFILINGFQTAAFYPDSGL